MEERERRMITSGLLLAPRFLIFPVPPFVFPRPRCDLYGSLGLGGQGCGRDAEQVWGGGDRGPDGGAQELLPQPEPQDRDHRGGDRVPQRGEVVPHQLAQEVTRHTHTHTQYTCAHKEIHCYFMMVLSQDRQTQSIGGANQNLIVRMRTFLCVFVLFFCDGHGV